MSHINSNTQRAWLPAFKYHLDLYAKHQLPANLLYILTRIRSLSAERQSNIKNLLGQLILPAQQENAKQAILNFFSPSSSVFSPACKPIKARCLHAQRPIPSKTIQKNAHWMMPLICSFLNITEQNQLSAVCSEWNEIQPAVWNHTFGNLTTLRYTEPEHVRHLNHLCVMTKIAFFPWELPRLLPNLNAVSIANNFFDWQQGVEPYASKIKNLSLIFFQGNPYCNPSIFGNIVRHLNYLHIRESYAAVDLYTPLQPLAASCSRLGSLVLEFEALRHPSDDIFSLLSGCHCLTKLSITCPTLPLRIEQTIAKHCKQLNTLVLQETYTRMPYLESPSHKDVINALEDDLIALSRLPLTMLSLPSYDTCLTRYGVQALASCASLTHLLLGQPSFTDQHVVDLASGKIELQALYFGAVPKITNQGVISIIKRWPDLRIIDVALSGINQEGIDALFDMGQALSDVGLPPSMGKAGVAAAVKYGKLRSLWFINTPQDVPRSLWLQLAKQNVHCSHYPHQILYDLTYQRHAASSAFAIEYHTLLKEGNPSDDELEMREQEVLQEYQTHRHRVWSKIIEKQKLPWTLDTVIHNTDHINWLDSVAKTSFCRLADFIVP